MNGALPLAISKLKCPNLESLSLYIGIGFFFLAFVCLHDRGAVFKRVSPQRCTPRLHGVEPARLFVLSFNNN